MAAHVLFPTAETLAAALNGKPSSSGNFSACCPAHEDRNASLSIGTGRNGQAVFKCHAGCTQVAIMDELRDLGLLPARINGQGQKRRIVATYDYRDAHDKVLFQVVRYEPKDFRQRQPDGKGGWQWNLKGITSPPPYRLPEVLAAIKAGDALVICEGEKDCDTAVKLGFAATTNHGGAGKWRDHHARQIAGAKVAYIIPDNNPPGRKHAQQVAASVEAASVEARVVTLPDAVVDLTEWVEKGGDRDKLLVLMEQAAPATAVAEPEPDAADTEGSDWRSKLILSEKGKALPILRNAALALRHAPEWRGVFAYNEFSDRVEVNSRPPYRNQDCSACEVTDRDILLTTDWLQTHGILVSTRIVHEAIQMAGHERRFHPVRDYLDSLTWDKTPRLDTWLSDYLGALNTPLNRAFAAKWTIAAVARIYAPGCKVDNAIILEGRQGLIKSGCLKALGDPWFTDEMPDIGSRDALAQLRGVWIVELAELTSLSKQESHRIKSFMSSSVDRYREPYAKTPRDFPRQSVFGGTINPEGGYLKDATGARRFWTVACGVGKPENWQADVEGLRAHRDQLWAEAVARFRAGETWWLSQEFERQQTEAAADRYQGDAWDDLISVYCDGKSSVTVGEILREALGLDPSKWTRPDQMRVGTALTAMGRQRVRVMVGKRREYRYVLPALPDEVGQQVGQRQCIDSKGIALPTLPTLPNMEEKDLGNDDGCNGGSGGTGGIYKKGTDLVGQVGQVGQCVLNQLVTTALPSTEKQVGQPEPKTQLDRRDPAADALDGELLDPEEPLSGATLVAQAADLHQQAQAMNRHTRQARDAFHAHVRNCPNCDGRTGDYCDAGFALRCAYRGEEWI